MKTIIFAVVAAALGFFVFANANEPAKPTQMADKVIAKTAEIQEVSVEQVKQLMADNKTKFAIVDANNDGARKDAGTIANAILLTSYNQYALSELPADKATTLVFYCYNSYCQASHAAAERAIGAGYTDVRVMKAGIAGWNKANKA
jgi:rhodanese-related sulfurtransferase